MNKIEINNLKIRKKEQSIFVVENLILNPGDLLYIDGKNGIGKTLFLKILSGDIIFERGLKYEGSIKISGTETIHNLNNENIRLKVCYISQEDNLFTENTVLDEFLIAFRLRLGLKNKDEVLDLLKENKIDELAPDIYNNLNENPKRLSGGNQRLITILIWLLSSEKADLFLIDEPLQGLDIYNVSVVNKLLKQIIKNNPEAIVLIVSHIAEHFDFLNGKLYFNNNKIIKK